ncbi:C40 family peptidase [Sphaerisporangium siamense]|uniref:Cell wall-associated NlpC family hydrolase n=1 Tax=Sphaerisporangium siamense TaxID=795645 RepID=A0A7W7GC59_9ACTN|nr:NlpC/P60 family protein [Sphaerisporangium siamense]MBB4705713.1 cell wall-associated NlpC family hydrolase [Sphaerisporangium siamense]
MRRAVRLALAGGVLVLAAGSAPLVVAKEPNRLVAIASAIEDGQRQSRWAGGAIPYVWGGGHAKLPGPSRGTCLGYHGSIRPCPAATTTGLDCSGLARWVYHLAFKEDVLGPGNTDDHLRRLRKVPARAARPGDLVFYGKVRKRSVRTHHVGIYVGDGMMINALRTGTTIRTDPVDILPDLAGYYRYER